MLDRMKIDEIKKLRMQGKSYCKIAEVLKVSKGSARKYGKGVEIKEKPKKK